MDAATFVSIMHSSFDDQRTVFTSRLPSVKYRHSSSGLELELPVYIALQYSVFLNCYS